MDVFLSFFANIDWSEIWLATGDTMTMLFGSLFFTVLLGLPLGVLLFLTSPRQLFEQKGLYALLSLIVNILRSLPFIILLIVMIPFTVLITGTSLGVAGAIPPLVVGATPFFARLVETALREVDRGIIEATQAMGATTRPDHHQRPVARSPPWHLRGDYGDGDYTGFLHRDGWCGRCWRPGRPGNPFWLPALPDRCDGGHRGDAVDSGANSANRRRPAGGALFS